MKEAEVRNNPSAASIILMNGDKDLDIACSVIMGESDIAKNPLQITDAEMHTCVIDEEKGISSRRYNGINHKANPEVLRNARDQRIKQGKEVRRIEEKEEIEI